MQVFKLGSTVIVTRPYVAERGPHMPIERLIGKTGTVIGHRNEHDSERGIWYAWVSFPSEAAGYPQLPDNVRAVSEIYLAEKEQS